MRLVTSSELVAQFLSGNLIVTSIELVVAQFLSGNLIKY